MKVALLGPYPVGAADLTGAPALPGGVDAVVVSLSRGLASHADIGLNVVTAVPGLPAAVQTVSPPGFPIHQVPRPRGGRLTGQRRVVRFLAEVVRDLQVDVVHAHSAGIYAEAAFASGAPAVITLHGIIWREMQQAWPTSSWPDRLRWLSDSWTERRVFRKASRIVAISPYVLEQLRGRTAARFHTVENPVDDRYFSVPAERPNRDRLLCVARVIPRKGILNLLRAFALVLEDRPAAELVIAGEFEADPAYAAACRTLAGDLGVSGCVSFLGARPPDAIFAEYAAADLVVLASEQETAPVSIAEGMAAARPVVATDVGGCASMVADGVTGRIVPSRNPAALAAAVSALLGAPELRSRMAAAARAEAAKRFRLASIVEATLEVYREAMGTVR